MRTTAHLQHLFKLDQSVEARRMQTMKTHKQVRVGQLVDTVDGPAIIKKLVSHQSDGLPEVRAAEAETADGKVFLLQLED